MSDPMDSTQTSGGEESTDMGSEEKIGTNSQRLRVILDLDEVLVHTYYISLLKLATGVRQVVVDLKKPKSNVSKMYGDKLTYYEGVFYEWNLKYVRRPWLGEFLRKLAELDVEVLFWTASRKLYADAIFDQILPPNLKDCPRLYRDSCDVGKRRDLSGTVEYHFKDLRTILDEEQLTKSVLIDDSKSNMRKTPKNGIICQRWMGVLEDEMIDPPYLSQMLDAIKQLMECDDVRTRTKELEAEIAQKATEVKAELKAKATLKRQKSRFNIKTLLKGFAAYSSTYIDTNPRDDH